MPHDIFLSYSRADEPTMRQIYDHLSRAGFPVWIDQTGIPPGTPSWKRAIESAIDATRCVVVIFSPDAKNSHWVREEMDYANAQGKPIYPILARGDATNAVPFGHTTAQWVDIRNKSDISAEMSKLAAQIGVTIGVPVKPITPPSAASRPSPSSAVGTGYIPSLPNPAPPKSAPVQQPTMPRPKAKPTASPAVGTSHTPQKAVPQPAPSAAPAIKPLRPWNPIDHVRLLWWIFVQPKRYMDYREQMGKEATLLAGNWLSSTLIWLPMFIPVTAAALGIDKLPLKSEFAFGITFPALSFMIILGWLASMILSGFAAPRIWVFGALLVAIGAGCVVPAGVSFGLLFNPVMGLAFGLVIGLPLGISEALAIHLEDKSRDLTMVSFVLLTMAFGMVTGVSAGMVDIMSPIVTVIMAFLVGATTELIVRRGLMMFRTFGAGILILSFLILSYLALIWIYWLGGWRVLP